MSDYDLERLLYPILVSLGLGLGLMLFIIKRKLWSTERAIGRMMGDEVVEERARHAATRAELELARAAVDSCDKHVDELRGKLAASDEERAGLRARIDELVSQRDRLNRQVAEHGHEVQRLYDQFQERCRTMKQRAETEAGKLNTALAEALRVAEARAVKAEREMKKHANRCENEARARFNRWVAEAEADFDDFLRTRLDVLSKVRDLVDGDLKVVTEYIADGEKAGDDDHLSDEEHEQALVGSAGLAVAGAVVDELDHTDAAAREYVERAEPEAACINEADAEAG